MLKFSARNTFKLPWKGAQTWGASWCARAPRSGASSACVATTWRPCSASSSRDLPQGGKVKGHWKARVAHRSFRSGLWREVRWEGILARRMPPVQLDGDSGSVRHFREVSWPHFKATIYNFWRSLRILIAYLAVFQPEKEEWRKTKQEIGRV